MIAVRTTDNTVFRCGTSIAFEDDILVIKNNGRTVKATDRNAKNTAIFDVGLPEGVEANEATYTERGGFVIIASAQADIDARATEKTRKDTEAAVRPAKLAGVKLGSIMASATRDDQDGLTAISVGVIMKRAAGKTFPDTVFKFVNGEKLLITDANFDGYFATWSAFRQKFFAPKGL